MSHCVPGGKSILHRVVFTHTFRFDPMPTLYKLQRCRPAEFEVVVPSSMVGVNAWAKMGAGWADDAAPGDWVRRRGIEPDEHPGNRRLNRLQPHGIVVSALSSHQVDGDPSRFLVLWFR